METRQASLVVTESGTVGWLRAYVFGLAIVGAFANGWALATREPGWMSVLNLVGLVLAIALFYVGVRLPGIALTLPGRVRSVIAATAVLALANGAVGLAHREFGGVVLAAAGVVYMGYLIRVLGRVSDEARSRMR